MKKTSILFTLVFMFIASAGGVQAQKIKGKAVYKTKRHLKIDKKDLGGKDELGGLKKEIMKMLKSSMEKEFELSFNENESSYKEIEKIDQKSEAASSGMVTMKVMGSATEGKEYRNIKEGKIIKQRDIQGKKFLIHDSPAKLDWKSGKESKMIGGRLCLKATAVYEREKRKNISFSRLKDGEKEEDKAPEMEEITITAWYAPDVPVKHGPGKYSGLSGLILELNDGDFQIICTKLTINPKEGVTIEAPKRGKIITQEKFDKILKKNREEMLNRMGGHRKGGGSRIIMEHN